MKFYLMRGEGAHDGVVAFNVDEPYFDQDFSEDIEDYIWCMKYNDEIAPAVSNIETSDGDNRPLTQEEITKYSALAETLYNECRDRVSAERGEMMRSIWLLILLGLLDQKCLGMKCLRHQILTYY